MMLRRLRICRTLGCIMVAATLFYPVVSSAKEECIDKEYARGMTIGGVLGTGAGIVAAAATGVGVATFTAGAAAGGGIMAAIAVDCATTLCLGTVIGGTLVGIGIGFLWLFSDGPEDCAGVIYYSPKRESFTVSWDRDSIDEALKDGKKYCENKEGGTCEPIALFRECVAVAQDHVNRVWAVGMDSTGSAAIWGARKECKAKGGTYCEIQLTECNSG